MQEGQIITLENNKDYIIIKRVSDNGNIYDYLMTAEKPIEVLFMKEETDGTDIFLNEIENEELERVISLFEN